MRERWSFKTFGDIMSPARVIRCSERKLPVLSITMRNGIVEQNERFNKSIASKDRSNYKVVKNGQLVIAFPIDEGLIYTQDIVSEGIMSPAYNVWDVNYNLVDRRFLVAYFHSSYAFTYYKAKLKGTTQRRRSMDKSDLLSMPIPIPPLAEQERIVAELDLLSSIIEKKKAQLKEFDQLAQSIFYDMFGDLYSTVFPTMTLIDICEFIKDGTHQTPTYTEDKENGIKFLSAKDVVEGVINWENIKYISVELHKELHKRIAPKRNDLLLCKNGTTGICAIVETDEIFDIYVSLALLRPKEPFCPKYLLYAINNPYTKEQFDKSLKGVGVPNLHLGEIKKAKIIYPPLPLQQEFASKIEAIERQKSLIQQSIVETQTLFDSRMQHWFS